MAFSPEYSPRCLQVLNRRCPVPVNHTNIFRLSSFTLHVNNSRISTGISLVDSSFDSLLQSKEITYNPGKYIPLKYMYSLVDPQYAKQHLMYPQTIFRTFDLVSLGILLIFTVVVSIHTSGCISYSFTFDIKMHSLAMKENKWITETIPISSSRV